MHLQTLCKYKIYVLNTKYIEYEMLEKWNDTLNMKLKLSVGGSISLS